MRVSLVLATIHRVVELERCLDSLLNQTDQNFEVLVIDQNPDDRLVPKLLRVQALGLNAIHVRLKSAGLSNARNVGIKMASGEIVAFPDDDCWYEPFTIAAIKKAFSDNPRLMGCVARWFEQSQARGDAVNELELTSAAWRNFRGGDASSISLFLRRSIIDELNGFDPRLGVGRWYGAAEETDLVMRALATGAQFRRCSEAVVHHAFSAVRIAPDRKARMSARWRARGTGAIYAKHRLGAWTIFRGFASPFLKSLIRGDLAGVLDGGNVSLGRIEGYLKWRMEEK